MTQKRSVHVYGQPVVQQDACGVFHVTSSPSLMKSGYVAIVGRPNVGKSTLLNHLLGQKISITSRRPQTTRHRIHGIKTTSVGQAVFVDTPGIHANEKRAMNRYLNRAAGTAFSDVDVILWVIDKPEFHQEDELVLKRIRQANLPVILAINKIDRIDDKELLLPFLQAAEDEFSFAARIPLPALRGLNLEELETTLSQYLPEGDPISLEDQVTDR